MYGKDLESTHRRIRGEGPSRRSITLNGWSKQGLLYVGPSNVFLMEFRGMLILLQLCSCWTDPWQPLITFFSMLFTPGELMGSESFRWLFLGIFHVAFMSQRFLSSSWMLLPLQCFIPIQSRKWWRYSFLIHQLGPRCGIPSSASLQHNDMGRWPITKQLSETVCLFDVMYLVFWGFPVMHSSRHVSCLDSVPQADLHGRVSESERFASFLLRAHGQAQFLTICLAAPSEK